MSEVRVKEGESLENALKRFKRSCAKAGVIAEVKKREHYVSPSLKLLARTERSSIDPFPVHKTKNAPCRRTERFLSIASADKGWSAAVTLPPPSATI